MFVYIDAVFKPNEFCTSVLRLNTKEPQLVTTDTIGVHDTAPYMLDVAAIMTATSAGVIQMFEGNDPKKMLSDFGQYIEQGPFTFDTQYVGWFMDQIVIPVICANSFRRGVPSVTKWMRRLDDKWSKTMALSLERGFLQGWYPMDKNVRADEYLTLGNAMNLCGMVFGGEDHSGSKAREILSPRIYGINKLHFLYNESTIR
jgi:hypothetical protein